MKLDRTRQRGGERIEVLEDYELLRKLSIGSTATVYLARRRTGGRKSELFAIKRLHGRFASDPEAIEMFLDEARLAAMIDHPNVLPVVEVGTSPRGYFLVMHYVDGDTFARLLARASTFHSGLPLPITVRIVVDVLSGLHAAHEAADERGQSLGVVHRDVSPQNVLVGLDGVSRIGDFGVSRARNRLTTTHAGQMKGKLAYMAPEQARAEPVDRRTDVFAAGVMLWEALASRRLFKAESGAATLGRVVSAPVPSLSRASPVVPQAIEQVVLRALERDPGGRYPTAAAFGAELEAAALDSGVLVGPLEVADYVKRVMPQRIADQQESARAWLAIGEPSQTTFAEGGLESDPEPEVSTPGSVIPVARPLPYRESLPTLRMLDGSSDDGRPSPRRHRERRKLGPLAAAAIGTALGAATLLLVSSLRTQEPVPPLSDAVGTAAGAVARSVGTTGNGHRATPGAGAAAGSASAVRMEDLPLDPGPPRPPR